MSAPVPTVLVLGCGDIGSGIAHRLFHHRVRVLVCDLPKPAHARRGMAFTDVFFDGEARLEGVLARFAPDIPAVLAIWEKGDALPAATLPEGALIGALRPDILIDATMRQHERKLDRRPLANVVVGIGAGFAPGRDCHAAIETQWGENMGAVLRCGATAERTGVPRLLDGIGHDRFVKAVFAGHWHTRASIGQAVHAREAIGTLNGVEVCAPIDGALRGLSHDGVEVGAGRKFIEVDPRTPPNVFGVGKRPRAVAEGICRVLEFE